MEEIAPGLWWWSTMHPRWGIRISSYLLADDGVVIDPRVPEEGIDAVAALATPRDVLLSCRHHFRDSEAFVARFGCRVHCNRAGLHEFGDGAAVRPFDPGDELPGGVVALEVDAISPDETALHLTRQRAVVVADGVVREPFDGPLVFVPDELMDDPERTKEGLFAAFDAICELEWDHLLPAHGAPVMDTGHEALQAFAAGVGGD